MKRIDQAEINYIFRALFRAQDFSLSPRIDTAPNIPAILTRYPVSALAATWHVAYGRSGLSPFTMHYLLQSPLPVEEWTKKNLLNSKIVTYSFCHSTNLPVVNNHMRFTWNYPILVKHTRPAVHTYYDHTYYDKLKERRDARFEELRLRLEADKAAGLVDDEYMRRFGGFPVAKHIWQHLKGVAGIYL